MRQLSPSPASTIPLIILFLATLIPSINSHAVRHPSLVGLAPCDDHHLLHRRTLERCKTSYRGQHDINGTSGTTVPLCLYQEDALHSLYFRTGSGLKRSKVKGAYSGETFLYVFFSLSSSDTRPVNLTLLYSSCLFPISSLTLGWSMLSCPFLTRSLSLSLSLSLSPFHLTMPLFSLYSLFPFLILGLPFLSCHFPDFSLSCPL